MHFIITVQFVTFKMLSRIRCQSKYNIAVAENVKNKRCLKKAKIK